jgi:hypothetical protein
MYYDVIEARYVGRYARDCLSFADPRSFAPRCVIIAAATRETIRATVVQLRGRRFGA